MANDKNQFGQNNNSPSKSNKDTFRTNKQSTFDMFNINVKKAQKDIDTIFGTAKKSTEDYTSSFTKSINKAFDNAISRAKEFERVQINSARRVSSAINGEYDKLGRNLRESQIGIGDTIYNEISKGFDKASKQFSEMNITANVKTSGHKSDDESKSDKSTDELKNGIKSVGQSIDSTIDKGIGIFVKRFERGIDKLVDMYESSFGKVSVLQSTTAKEYRQYQSDTASALKDMDLNNNIRTSDIMKKLEDVSMKGLIGEDAKNKALADTISNTIAPFLDTTTDAYTDLQLKLGTNFVNEMNGMVKAVSDTAGSSRFISRNINDILSQLEPIATNAKNEQFSQQFGEMAATIDSLVQSGDMTMSQANELKETVMLSMDPYKALQSGNLAAKTAAATATEEQLRNPQEMLKLVGNTLTYFGDMSQGQDPRARGAMASAIGVDTMGFTWNAVTSSEFTKALDNSKGLGNLSDTGKLLQKNLAGDQYTTEKQQREIRAENDVTGVAKFAERFPDAYSLIDSISGTLGSIENLLKIQTTTDIVSGISDAKGLIKGITENSKHLGGIKDLVHSVKDYKKSDVINLSSLGSTGNKMKQGSGILGKVADVGFESGAKGSRDALVKGITNVAKNGFTKITGSIGKVATKGISKMTSIASSFGGSATKLLSSAGSIATKGIKMLSKAAGPLMAAVGGLMAVKDGFKASKKSQEWLGDNSLRSKGASFTGGLIGGSGPGVGEGADPEAVKKNVKRNAGKWAAIGAGIGTMVGGPLGTAIGGAIGAGVGAITGAIGGKRIAKAAKGIGDLLHKGIDGAIKSNPITNIMQRQFNHIKENSKEAFSEMKNIWGDKDKGFLEKVSGTFGVITKTMKDNREDWKKSFTEFADDAKEKINKVGETFKNIGHAFTKEGAKENLNKIKEKFIGKAKSMKDSYNEAQSNIEETNQSKEEQIKGSHASGLDSVPYDGYLAKLHKGESIFNKQATNMIKTGMGITAKSVGALSSLSPISRMSSFIKGGIEGMSSGTSGDNSDVVKAIEIATSKLIEAISSNSGSSEPKLTDNKDGLLPTVTSFLLGGAAGKAVSSMINLQGSMPSAKEA